MNLPVKPDELHPVDGFDSHNDEASTGGAEFAKFDAGHPEKLWHGRDGAAVYPGPYLAVDCKIEILRWQDQKVIERIDQSPLPDIDALNDAIPQSEWEEDRFTGGVK